MANTKHFLLHPMNIAPFLMISLSCCCPFLSFCYACKQYNRDSLLSFSLSSPPSSTPLNWSSTTDCCHWEGITCDQKGWVIHLWLPSRGLQGDLSPALVNLTHLTHLNLSHNSLTGLLIDSFFASLNRLECFDLSSNSLRGEPFSSPTSSHSNDTTDLSLPIQTLDLSSNHFHGKILVQESFLKLAWNLSYFNVRNNSFIGSIPTSICIELGHLRLLDFSINGFTGEVPRGLVGCSKLEVLRAGSNSLLGPIPGEIYRMQALQEINLASAGFSGPIGSSIVNLTNLVVLELQFNKLTGILPWDMGRLAKLEKLALHKNNMTGRIPTSMMNCTSLRELNLGFNLFQGELSAHNFSKLQNLKKLDLSNNHLLGRFPSGIYSCKHITAMRLAHNNLQGQISPGMLALQSLSFLSLTGNNLTNITGAIRILAGCKNLTVLILSSNFQGEVIPNDDETNNIIVSTKGFQNIRLLSLLDCGLSGQLPTWLKTLKNLQVLRLSFNQLTGTIPDWLGNLPSLFYIDLRQNLLTGSFHLTLCGLPALTMELITAKPDQTLLELPIFFSSHGHTLNRNTPPLQYNRLSNFPRALLVGQNNLSGIVPEQLGLLKHLQMLDLSYNNFSGRIPSQLSELSELEVLQLSRNRFAGAIPGSLTGLHFLSEFDVSHNHLRGAIPVGTQLQSFDASSYVGNLELCGSPLPKRCEIAITDDDDDDADKHESTDGDKEWRLYASTGIGFSLGFGAVCYGLLLHPHWILGYAYKFQG